MINPEHDKIWLATARSYKRGANVVWGYCSDNPDVSMLYLLPMLQLTAQSAECYLKAWATIAGYSQKEIKDFGHNLTKIFGHCMQRKEIRIADLHVILNKLDDDYKKNYFRYRPHIYIYPMSNFGKALETLATLDSELDQIIKLDEQVVRYPGDS